MENFNSKLNQILGQGGEGDYKSGFLQKEPYFNNSKIKNRSFKIFKFKTVFIGD